MRIRFKTHLSLTKSNQGWIYLKRCNYSTNIMRLCQGIKSMWKKGARGKPQSAPTKELVAEELTSSLFMLRKETHQSRHISSGIPADPI